MVYFVKGMDIIKEMDISIIPKKDELVTIQSTDEVYCKVIEVEHRLGNEQNIWVYIQEV